ncbi:hypothetical protein [Pseudomonas syringae group genomosp. 3]|uniref:hypothetical protein n=1 Tax=Pseudomonas syringae group genomosp. 3 TaxID=251701 RepID=UPI0006E6BFFA|nr:hypothetical protein [Pseudomonas syringae group genomosp. 3]KPW44534.1 Uncharacterized protein ALO86_00827 [Pseudomonas syringae pv. berberidis]KPY18162.1 Uncharacterized protein ALO54_01828 [Pseudomonas syringae pv. philadelphi]RMM33141.1 hypothetical protein ALQ83_01831 [Pseudomonas syringae pv. berberidis]RMP69514.1 hypothetical protein ALQ19_00943 [Pseudomonas syringae pv. berberidis]RMQ34177.1 hypothetical protein ALQ06_02893 [Pseudomonas syringae pv. berberidis]
MAVQDVSFGLGGLVCLMCVSSALLEADFASAADGLSVKGGWIFNLALQTDGFSVDGYLAHEKALSGAGGFGGVAVLVGFA